MTDATPMHDRMNAGVNLIDAYIEETGDSRPIPPKRMWVSKLKGIPTRNGELYLEEYMDWNNRMLNWINDALREEQKLMRKTS